MVMTHESVHVPCKCVGLVHFDHVVPASDDAIADKERIIVGKVVEV